MRGCFSACSTAFIAGRKRYLVEGANLGFHAYGVSSVSLRALVDIQHEQQKDQRIYEQQGVSRDFLDRLFSADHDSMWYPEIDELIDHNIVHEVIRGQDLLPIQYQVSKAQVDEALLQVPVFKIIKQEFPDTYQEIQSEFQSQVSKGLPAHEIQLALGIYIERIALHERAETSDETLVQYTLALIEILRQFSEEDPAQCLKILFPGTYGTTRLTEYLSNRQSAWLINILSQIIIDAQGQQAPFLDREAALADADVIQLLQPPTDLNVGDDFQQACIKAINHYEAILAKEKNTAVNGLRYIYSEQK